MNLPVCYNFDDQYRRDGLMPIELILSYESGTAVPFDAVVITMQLRNIKGVVVWEFSTLANDIDKKLIILPNGKIKFPRIPSWDIPAGKCYYDLQVVDYDGFTRTYMAGTWKVNQDTTY